MADINQKPKIYFAPLQEFTDWIYRKNHAEIFGGIDKYFAPYISCQNDGTVKKSHIKDVFFRSNSDYNLVPQILAGNSKDFIFLAKLLIDLGYQEINWNLGCPYPMVTNKGQGSGLLPYPEKIDKILSESLPGIDCNLSIKLRSGLSSHEELFPVIEVLNNYPLREVILHPRTGKQLYKGTANPEIFLRAREVSKNTLTYNGDLTSIEEVKSFGKIFVNQSRWMIGRGILKEPFLPQKLKKGSSFKEDLNLLEYFHSVVFCEYSKLLSGNSHLLMRMLKFWNYFCYSFPDPHKTFKRIKKARSVEMYEAAVRDNFLRLFNEHEKNECCKNTGPIQSEL